MKKIFTLMSMALMVLALGFSQKAMAADTYVVAGSQAILGSNWNGTDVNNQMTPQSDGTMKLRKSSLALAAGTYEYKIVKNGSTWIPDGMGNNQKVYISEEGLYDITFTFTPDDASTIKAEAVKTGSAHVDVTCVVAGQPASLFGTEWDQFNTDNLLAEQSDGSFSKTYENVELTASVGIQYKFIINGNWEEGDNHVVSVPNSGIYNVKFTYWPSDNYGQCDIDPVTVNPLVIEVMSITGELTGGWANADWSNEGAWMDMTQESENVWTLVVTGAEIEAGTYYYKAAANHNWNEYCIPGDGSNKEFTFDESGIYTLKFVANTETDELTLGVERTGNIVVPDPTLFILGEANDNGWAPNVGVEMTYLDGKFTAEDVTFKGLNEGFSYFSFTTKLAEDPDDWDYITPFRIGAVSDGDFLVTDELLGQEISLTSDGGQALKIPAGIYTLGVNLETMKLVLTKTGTIDPTAIESVEVETANNVYYNLQGQRVAAPTKGIYIHNGRKVIVK